MVKGVLFGQPASLIKIPGAYTEVNFQSTEQPDAFDPNRVVVVGPASGGEPFKEYRFNDASYAAQVFGYSPLAEAVLLAFDGGEKGGATTVTAIRVDDCARATAYLAPQNSGAGIRARVKDWGAYGNLYTLTFRSGTVQGTMAVIEGNFIDGRRYYRKFDNVASFSQLISLINRDSPIEITQVEGGTFASQTFTLTTNQINGRATVRDIQGVDRTTQAFCYQFPVSTLQDFNSMVVSFPEPISWAIASVDTGANTFTTGTNHTLVDGNLVRVEGTALDSKAQYVVRSKTNNGFKLGLVQESPQSVNVTAIDPATNTFTSPGHPFAAGDGVKFTSGSGPATRDRIYFISDVGVDTFRISQTVGGAVFDFSADQAQTLVATRIMLNQDVLTAGLDVTSAKVVLLFGTTKVFGSTPDQFNGDRVPSDVVARYTQAITGASVTSSPYGSDMARVTLSTEAWGYELGRALPGAMFTIDSGAFSGTYVVTHYDWSGLGTDKIRVIRKLTGDRVIPKGVFTGDLNFYPFIRLPKAQDLSEAIYTYIPANGLLSTGGQYISLMLGSQALSYSTQPGDSVQSVVQILSEMVNQQTEAVELTAAATYDAANYQGVLKVIATTPGLRRDKVGLLINPQPTLVVTAGGAQLQGGSDPIPPRLNSGEVGGTLRFSGGFDSAPTYQRWLSVTETLRSTFGRYFVPVSGDPGVHAIFSEHVNLMSATINRRERMLVCGHKLGLSKADVKNQAVGFESQRVVFVSAGARMPDFKTGALKLYPAYLLAAKIAGMLSAEGNGVSDPITHTYLTNVYSLEFDYSRDSVELESMLDAGVLVVESDVTTTRQSRGYWVALAINTKGESITLLNQADFVAARVRERQEILFVGRAAFADTLRSVKNETNLELNRLTSLRYIYGFDPTATTVSVNPDNRKALNVFYRVYFASDIDYVLNTQIMMPNPIDETALVA